MSQKSIVKLGAGKDLTDEDMKILKIRSKLDEAEIHRLHAEFWRDNPTGKMDKNAYDQFYAKLNSNSSIRKISRDIAFALFDVDHDKSIDFVEFLMANAFESAKNVRDAFGYLFEMCDLNCDGRMELSELLAFDTFASTAVVDSQHPGTFEILKIFTTIFKMIGFNTEKKLTKEQFIEECEKIPLLKKTFDCEK